jgi:hypothetical protein
VRRSPVVGSNTFFQRDLTFLDARRIISQMTNHQQVTDRMQSLIQQMENASDRRAIFLRCYLLMTQNMLKAIEVGEFTDPSWVSTLLDRFADYYFDALNAYELNSPATPAVWRLTHRAAGRSETLVLQNLLLGINAHINYDLVLTLVEMLEPEWRKLALQQREERYADHCHVNHIIGQTIDTVQDEVVEDYSPLLDVVDKMMGRIDEWLISRLITDWRDEVWDEAIHMLETADPDERQRLRQQIEEAALKRADTILLNRSGIDKG